MTVGIIEFVSTKTLIDVLLRTIGMVTFALPETLSGPVTWKVMEVLFFAPFAIVASDSIWMW